MRGGTDEDYKYSQPIFGRGHSGKSADNTGGRKAYSHRPRIPNWLKSILLIGALSIGGLIASRFVESLIPFWLLFGSSVFYSIDKWLGYYTRKYRIVGKIYRLILNLSALSLLGLLVWSGVSLFTQQFMQSPLIGSFVFLLEIAVFIWLCRVVSKNGWRQPSMKLTVFSLICLFFIFSFAGVQPLSDYKDSLFDSISIYFRNASQPDTTPPSSDTIPSPSDTTPFPSDTTPSPSDTTPSPPNEINSRTGEYRNYYLGLVYTPGGYLSGNGCYDDTGDFIVLINNENAGNPSYSQLVSFLEQDNTDQFPYIFSVSLPGVYYGSAESHVNLEHIQNIIDGVAQPSNPHVCADFAERLHNNAELAGIRCAYVSVTLDGSTGHGCDAFQTTDRGLIYIDVTGWLPNQPHPDRAVSTVSIVVGRSYTPVSLFHEAGWQDSYVSMGTVTDFQVIWDGSWND